MNLGESLFNARKSRGLTQEEAAGKLGVSRQTVSKWETGETLPDIRQAKRLAVLYGVSLDELIDFDVSVREIQDVIDRTTEEVSAKIDWTKAWSRQYPILGRYRDEVDVSRYETPLLRLLDELEADCRYSALDAFLVLKDILGGLWNQKNSR
jgi:transcriptional regulator with XRE-family HTH domain